MAEIKSKRQFLDIAGLNQFWGIIDGKFANKTDAIQFGSIAFNATATGVDMSYTDSTSSKTGSSASIPTATGSTAGLLSPTDKNTIDNINNVINNAAPFHGLKIDGNEVNLTGRRANIGLDIRYTGTVEQNNREVFIDLLDLGYPEGQSWSIVTDVDEYNTNHAQGNKAYYAWNNGTTTTYYKWSQDNVMGPINNVGEPLMQQPVSSINVTEFVKAGLLQDADVVLKDNAMYLELTFITENGTGTKVVSINVTDLVDVYTEGEGIEITNSSLSADGKQKEGTIKLRVANYGGKNELGGIRVGYTDDTAKQLYKVQLDASGNAYVAVPWEHTSVNVISTDANTAGEKYLVITDQSDLNKVDANSIPTPAYNFKVEVGAGIKNAEALAGTSVQSVAVGSVSETDASVSKDDYIKVATTQKTRTVEVNGETKTINAGKEITAELTNSAKASLGLADTAVQDVKTETKSRGNGSTHTPGGDDLDVSLVNTDNANTVYTNGKGKKAIKVTLGQKTMDSLDKADTALQEIILLGSKLDIDNPAYSREEAELALGLGSAANVDVVEAIPTVGTGANGALVDADFKTEVEDKDATNNKEARYTVATTKAVKDYVDAQNTQQTTDLQTYVAGVIGSLDTVDDTTNGGKGHIKNGTTAAAYDYTNNKYAGEEGYNGVSNTILTQIGQTDGILDTTKTNTSAISIQDIHDFAPISSVDITNICNNTYSAN